MTNSGTIIMASLHDPNQFTTSGVIHELLKNKKKASSINQLIEEKNREDL